MTGRRLDPAALGVFHLRKRCPQTQPGKGRGLAGTLFWDIPSQPRLTEGMLGAQLVSAPRAKGKLGDWLCPIGADRPGRQAALQHRPCSAGQQAQRKPTAPEQRQSLFLGEEARCSPQTLVSGSITLKVRMQGPKNITESSRVR